MKVADEIKKIANDIKTDIKAYCKEEDIDLKRIDINIRSKSGTIEVYLKDTDGDNRGVAYDMGRLIGHIDNEWFLVDHESDHFCHCVKFEITEYTGKNQESSWYDDDEEDDF